MPLIQLSCSNTWGSEKQRYTSRPPAGSVKADAMDTRLVGLARSVAGGSRSADAVAASPAGAPASDQRCSSAFSSALRRWSSFHLKRGLHSSVSTACQGGIRPEAAATAIAAANGRADS